MLNYAGGCEPHGFEGLQEQKISRQFDARIGRLGTNDGARFHGLRDTFGFAMHRALINPAVIDEIAGHSKHKMTKTYISSGVDIAEKFEPLNEVDFDV